MTKPTYHVVAGPNGAGKTTLTRSGAFDGVAIVDPDDLARRMNPDAPETVSFKAGKEAVRMIRNNIEDGREFAQETTLSSVTTLATAKDAKENGYRVEMHFVGVRDVSQSQERVDDRVRQGGHDILAKDIERRYPKTFVNAERLAQTADKSTFYDNSEPDRPHRAVLTREGRSMTLGDDPPQWAKTMHGRLRERDRTEVAREIADMLPAGPERDKAQQAVRGIEGGKALSHSRDPSPSPSRRSVAGEKPLPELLPASSDLVRTQVDGIRKLREGREIEDRDR